MEILSTAQESALKIDTFYALIEGKNIKKIGINFSENCLPLVSRRKKIHPSRCSAIQKY